MNMSYNICKAVVDLLLTKNFWNISTIREKTRSLWMNNKDILEDDEQILLRYSIIETRRLVYNWSSSCIPSKILIAIFNSNVAAGITNTDIRNSILNDFKERDHIV